MKDLNNPAHPGHSNHLISTNGRKAQRVWHPDTPLFESTINELMMDWNRDSVEQCGFIDNEEQNLWYIDNVHEKPMGNFLMDEKISNEALEKIYGSPGRAVLGIFHTHPNNLPWPSPRDIVGWPNPRLEWRYFIVTGNDVVEWELL